MWLTGGFAAAASEVPVGGGNDALLALIGGIAVAVIGGATTVLVASINSRNTKTAPSPPAPSGAGSGGDMAFRDFVVGELAVARRRDDDGDERDEIQDRRLDQIERVLDLDNPEWRHR